MTCKPSIERLRSVLMLDSQSGILIWRASRGTRKAGTVSGTPHKGYVRISVDGKMIRAHQIVWALTHGGWPIDEIDHINGVKDDNRPCNLREVDRFANMQNRTKANKNNSTKMLGVEQIGRNFRARLTAHGRTVNLGVYESPEQASKAYWTARNMGGAA